VGVRVGVALCCGVKSGRGTLLKQTCAAQAWHIAETNLRCVRSYGICSANRNSLASDPDQEYT